MKKLLILLALCEIATADTVEVATAESVDEATPETVAGMEKKIEALDKALEEVNAKIATIPEGDNSEVTDEELQKRISDSEELLKDINEELEDITEEVEEV